MISIKKPVRASRTLGSVDVDRESTTAEGVSHVLEPVDLVIII